MKIVITGISGFVGQALYPILLRDNHSLIAAVRSQNEDIDQRIRQFQIEGINNMCDWKDHLEGVDVIVHCAARVHLMEDFATNPLESYRDVNTYGTLNLAKKAAEAGVKRFVFISSIKASGESTELNRPLTADNGTLPTDPYGLSKYEAEIGLRQISQKTGMEVVIIRPPLVYGAGVKANFAALLKLVKKGFPLPFALVNSNRRSMVSVYNLVDLIVNCISNPKASNQMFLVSDDEDLSTAGLIKHMAIAMGRSSRLLPVPMWLFQVVGKLTGKSNVVDRLVGSLQVDITYTKDTLGWKPPFSVSESMKFTVQSECIDSLQIL